MIMVFYKNFTLIITLVLTVVMFQCQESSNNPGPAVEKSNLIIIREAQAYADALALLDVSEGSDPFVLKSVKINRDSLTMSINVSYAGGCEKHQFSLIWPDAIILIYPPNFSVILNHNANGDMCEAWLSETLVIDLQDNSLRLSDQEIRDMTVTVINGSNPSEQVQTD